MDASVIIPSLNGFGHLSAYFPSIIDEAEKSDYRAEIIIVDDNSSDVPLSA